MADDVDDSLFEPEHQALHEKLMSGKCPWCGHEIIDGRVSSGHDYSVMKSHLRDLETRLFAKALLNILHTYLRNGTAGVRWMGAIRSGEMGLGAKELLPDLTVLLKDEDEKVRAAAKEAIRKITEGESGDPT
jgi:hypothetical protein